MRKQAGATVARGALRKLARLVAVDAVVVEQALDLDFADVEDAVQYFAAARVPGVETIVTGNPKGFKAGGLTMFSPAEVQARLA